MEQLNSGDKLRAAIDELESKRAYEERILKERLHLTYDNLKPANLIKNTLKEVTSSDQQDNIINTVAAVTAGYLTKLLFQRVSHSPFKKLIATAIQFGVTNAIVQNPKVVKVGVLILSRLLKSRSERSERSGSPQSSVLSPDP